MQESPSYGCNACSYGCNACSYGCMNLPAPAIRSLVAETPWQPTYHAVTPWQPTPFDVHGPCTVPTSHAQLPHASHNSPMHAPILFDCMATYTCSFAKHHTGRSDAMATSKVARMPWRPPSSPGCHCRIHPISAINLGCALSRE
ncbi:hypothetical protein F3Y22_tig00111273pilonHSYRG00093 [Hibiscus syriacus]|uniref:Uncharacterized protein n=1 Tax=Hibiscus syriacus TaxID=106335 RepID=A0A6A2YRZ4_HIBSY|nr:hypothetical protein F3Y22_tig00111273pilonHSYRG00093 [Hibiscus syriacus]